MDRPGIRDISEADIAKVSVTEIQAKAFHMNPEILALFMAHLHEDRDEKWREKLIALFQSVTSTSLLELMGRQLSLEQLQALISSAVEQGDAQNKLTALFVGLPLPVFTQFLVQANNQQMKLIKKEAALEPIQHQVMLLCHEITHTSTQEVGLLEQLEKDMEQFDSSKADMQDYLDLEERLKKVQLYFQETKGKLEKVLEIAWASSRTDLIEKSNILKETCLKISNWLIGSPRTVTYAPKGLYAKLEWEVFKHFGNSSDTRDIQALHDDEPGVEALAKLSVWYPKDYVEMGLLENEQLDLEQVDKLEEKVLHNLALLDLTTVAQFKLHKVFNKETLKAYVQQNLSKLS